MRQHFQKRQEKHTHRGLLPPKVGRRLTADHNAEEISGRLAVPALTRAKLAITNSFENLRSKPTADKKQKSLMKAEEEQQQQQQLQQKDDQLSQSHDRSLSPLFSRKSHIDTLMAPVTTSPFKGDKDTTKRNRSWTDMTSGLGKMRQLSHASVVKVSNNNKTSARKILQEEQDREKEQEQATQNKKSDGMVKTPTRLTPVLKKRNLHQVSDARHCMTPPASSSEDKYGFSRARGHRRTSSHGITRSWRQEIFDSVSSPTKLDSAISNNDICEL